MDDETRAIAVVDDDPAVLRSVSRLLRLNGFEPAIYVSPCCLLEEIGTLRPFCIVADLSMPELTGLELQRRLAGFGLEYPLVFITGYGDIRSSVQAMRGGAVDFLQKPFDPSELLDAVARALEWSVTARKLRDQRVLIEQRMASLSPRERQVFDQVVEGNLNKQIAAELGITEKTVKVHRARVMRKMAVRSLAQLARLAEQVQAHVGGS